MAEFRDFDLAKWEAPKRAARLSAVVKNYKTSEMLVLNRQRRLSISMIRKLHDGLKIPLDSLVKEYQLLK
ncbi:hypothetical protein [Vibrio sp. TBV020]|uniref:hypothetical protein n=1 Tax=Vibrio sp. TBV020 TaxID=3137398 RepID=UPI0038CDB19C